MDALELWQIAVLMGLDEEPERLQGPQVEDLPLPPRAEDDGPVVSGPRLRRVR